MLIHRHIIQVAMAFLSDIDLLPYFFALAAVVYPIVILVSIFAGAGFRKGAKFLIKAELAEGVAKLLADEYKELGFAVNLIGSFLAFAGKDFFPLDLSDPLLASIFSYHLALVVVFSVGVGLLRMSKDRPLPLIVGDSLGAWALIGGSLILLYTVFIYARAVDILLLWSMSVVVLTFLGALVVGMTKSGRVYFESARYYASRG
ncbi:MAG: hypothetical protein GTO63_22850 [Anaerolineae bacterium]|nr:hypothetical protein [Anaerolineae bacterium]